MLPRRESRIVRIVLVSLGGVSLAIGVMALFVPLVPTTPFLILAAACFARSSPRFERWMLEHPRFGGAVREWRARGAIPLKAKVFATVSIAVSAGLIWATVPVVYGAWAGTFCLMAVTVFIWTRPN